MGRIDWYGSIVNVDVAQHRDPSITKAHPCFSRDMHKKL